MNDKIRALLAHYDNILAQQGAVPSRADNPYGKDDCEDHLRWMIALMQGREGIDDEGKPPADTWSDVKVNRWLGYIQGQLQAFGLVTLQELRDQSRDLYAGGPGA